jgi:heme-binding NEAT domain protein
MPRHWMIDPDDQGTYTIDWSAFLSALDETISSSSWDVDSGLTKVSDSINAAKTKTLITVTGGTAGEEYEASNQITLGDGSKETRTITFGVKEK